MGEKKYQVFISSTYEDLKDERRAVEQSIIRAGDFPVGMEAFPAADEEQFEFIKSIIDQCDFYVLIIAGRYGSLASDGKSYTEKEYEYAVEKAVPVLAMLRAERGDLPASKTERDPESRDKLELFIESVRKTRVVRDWKTPDGLKYEVRDALDHAKATKKRPGWVRGGHSASAETLEKIISLQEENESLRERLRDATPSVVALANLAGLDSPLKLTGTYARYHEGTSYFEVDTSLGEIFELLAPHLLMPQRDNVVRGIAAKSVWSRHCSDSDDGSRQNFTIADELFQTVKIQLLALNLIELNASSGSLRWSLTETGKQEMVRLRALYEE